MVGGGWGWGGYIFGRRINWGVSFGYGGGGVTFLISLGWLKNHRSPSSPLSHKNVQSIEIRYDNATLFHNDKHPFSNFLFIIGIW